MREHGATKYLKEKCRCGVCRAGHAERIAGQRARRKGRIATASPDSPPTPERRSVSAPDARTDQARTVHASQPRVATAIAPVAAASADTATPRESDPEPGTWSTGLWETELLPLLSMPGTNADGYIGTVTLNPPYDYPEYLNLLESCREYFDDFPLEWEYEPGKGVHIWRTDQLSKPESAPVFIKDSPVRDIDAPISLTVAEKIRYSFSRNNQGMCQIKLANDNVTCHVFVGFNQYEWKFTVSGYPACQDHYTAIQADYPERCEYISAEKRIASAPKLARPRSNPERIIAPSVPVSLNGNTEYPQTNYPHDTDYPKWG